MEISIEARELGRIEQYLKAMPEDAAKELKKAVNRAEDAAHREALIQITRVYTASLPSVAKELMSFKATDTSLSAILVSRGRPRGAGNFDVSPQNTNPQPGWTSRSGYAAEIIRGNRRELPNNYFWLSGRAGNVHLFRRKDPHSRGKDLVRFSTVSTPQMLQNEEVENKVEEVTIATLENVFARGMERRLSKGV